MNFTSNKICLIGLAILVLGLQSCQVSQQQQAPKFTEQQTACWFEARALQDAHPTRVTTTAGQHHYLMHFDTLMLDTRAVNDQSTNFCLNLRRRPITVYFDLSQTQQQTGPIKAKQHVYGYVERKDEHNPSQLSFEYLGIR